MDYRSKKLLELQEELDILEREKLIQANTISQALKKIEKIDESIIILENELYEKG